MKKFIAGLSALALAGMITMSVSADTTIAPDPDNMPAPKPGSAGLEVSYDVSPTYTVTIPAAVELSPTETQTKNITATDVKLEQGAKIVVTLDSASNTESGSTFNAKIGDSTANYTITAGGANVAVGGKVAEFDTKDGEQSAALTFSKAEGATYAGKHTEQLTFGIAVETAPTTVDVTGVSLNKTTLELTADDTAILTATVSPDNATDKTVTWTSSDESVATVDSNGVVTPVGAGTATITAKAGDKTATCNVTVKASTVTLADAFKNGAEVSISYHNYWGDRTTVFRNNAGTYSIVSSTAIWDLNDTRGQWDSLEISGNGLIFSIRFKETPGKVKSTITFDNATNTYTIWDDGYFELDSLNSITINGVDITSQLTKK